MILTTTRTAILAISTLFANAVLAMPADFSFSGMLSNDDAAQLFEFSITTESTVTLRTWSYAGGVNAAGETISSGGFDPILSLYRGEDGSFLLTNDDGNDDTDIVNVGIDEATGEAFDSFISTSLAPGAYLVALTQFVSFPVGDFLSDGFMASGATNFDGGTGTPRNAAWAVDIVNVDSARLGQELLISNAVPLPGALSLFALGLFGLGWARRSYPT